MSAELARRLITVREYRMMAKTGILSEDDRVELLNGDIIKMSPTGSRHVACVNRLTMLIAPHAGEQAIISTQNPILINDFSQLEPDLALLKPSDDFYENQLAGAEDTLLVIEVSDTTLSRDREVKLPLYASSGIPEAWIINLEDQEIEVHREPSGKTYKKRELFLRGDDIVIKGLNLILKTDQILGRL